MPPLDQQTIGQRIVLTVIIVIIVLLVLAFVGWVTGGWEDKAQ
jgi:hypothetical protein